METTTGFFSKTTGKKSITLIFSIVLIFLVQFTTVKAEDYPEVTKSQVIEYLAGYNIKVTACNVIEYSDDWYTTNSDGTHAKVYVENGQIVGYEIQEL